LIREFQELLFGLVVEIWGGLVFRGGNSIRILGSGALDLHLRWLCAGAEHQRGGNQGP
jgi:hypothetical protein